MRCLIPMLLALTFSGPTVAAQLQMAPPQMARTQLAPVQPVAELSRLEPQMAGLSPGLRSWVSAEARAAIDCDAEPDAALIAGHARARLAGQDFSNADIEALVQLVLMQCAQDADADLRDAMEQVRAANERKAAMRESAATRKAASKGLPASARAEYAGAIRPQADQISRVAPTGPGISPPAQAASEPDLESMSEMSEMNSLRLQMLMDRRSKAFETLSNVLEKSSDTASTITSNLK